MFLRLSFSSLIKSFPESWSEGFFPPVYFSLLTEGSFSANDLSEQVQIENHKLDADHLLPTSCGLRGGRVSYGVSSNSDLFKDIGSNPGIINLSSQANKNYLPVLRQK